MSTDMERDMALLEEEVHRRRRNDRRQKWGLFVLAMLLMVTITVIAVLLYNAENRATVSGAQVVTEQDEKKEIAKEAQQALCREGETEVFDRELCEKWAAVAQEPPLPLPEPDIIGPTQAELILAFRAYCAETNNCKGADGRPPTADDIAAAFVKFCSDGRCTGPQGEKGQDAKPLAPEYGMVLTAVTEYCGDGACTGPSGTNGANATPEMVIAAVQQFCANDVCRGADGADGTDGEKGEKGDKGDAPTSITIMDPAGRKQTCTPNPPGGTDYTCTYDEGPGVKLP